MLRKFESVLDGLKALANEEVGALAILDRLCHWTESRNLRVIVGEEPNILHGAEGNNYLAEKIKVRLRFSIWGRDNPAAHLQ